MVDDGEVTPDIFSVIMIFPNIPERAKKIIKFFLMINSNYGISGVLKH